MTIGRIGIAILVALMTAGCQLMRAEPRTALEARADHFQSAGLTCGEPHVDPDYANLVVECRGTAAGSRMTVTLDDHPDGLPLVSASIPQALGRQAAAEIWSSVVLPMPGLESVRVELAAGLAGWASNGAAMFSLSGGLAWVSAGEIGEWTFSVDLDDLPQ